MVLEHTIGTNARFNTVGDEQLERLVNEIADQHPGVALRSRTLGLPRRAVFVTGNAALLRIVIDRLEAADFLS